MEDLKKYLYLGKKCNKCKKFYINSNKEFYSSHVLTINRIELNICKRCLIDTLDIKNIEQVLLVLETLDIPFIEDVWQRLINHYGQNSTIIGRYIAKMNLRSYRDFTYKDSKIFNDNNPPGQPC